MSMICFNNKNFGRCEIICFFKDVAIIELEKNIEKYVVTVGLNYTTKSWKNGYYCKSLKIAGEIFNDLLEYFYMVSFKI